MDDHEPHGSRIRISRNGRRRAAVLIAVQVLILVHLTLWILSQKYGWFGGKTITPVEPSEAMQTLELGFVNAGFIFFALALLSTLIFGRFFCGWACHIVMLQDFCSWIMKKCGIRPKPFRSRLLIFVPLLIGLYMFVWPTFKRLALFPILENAAPAALAYFEPVREWRGFENHLVSDHFWVNPDTRIAFPVIMAVPTLLVVGFAAVYFLGAKGFCTYGCPYGGFFAPLDEFAPGRIRVDPDKCHECGHCTAVCTSNVRVHEEVREYGMVVDPGCMKCMDCVSVCPNDALSFGFGKPATKKGRAKNRRPKKIYDLSLREDISLAIVFGVGLFGVRGVYLKEGVPLLMAVAVAGVLAFLIFKTWRLFINRLDIVKIQNLKLKWRGRITRTGWIFAAITLLCSAVVAQNALVNFHRWRATVIQRGDVGVTREQAFSPFNSETVPPDARRAAERAINHLEKTRGIADGGFALMTNPAVYPELAWLHIVAGEFDRAETNLTSFMSYFEPGEISEHLHADMIRLKLLQNKRGEAIEYAETILSRNPENQEVNRLLDVIRSQ